ncbi:hypothetical protein CVT24_010007 [Panaeolus cyanescens]|uniref:Metal homeostatis protein BSD2 n=1 Tax=Panaeolus cyanescens TaxID=181874 RepID=A0A409VY61_9AGAR|nr:hypothetical protein CVT24_010007 [Panaeolus cyanescens]
MPARYAPLPNPQSAQDADREMEEAFGLDDEHDDERSVHEETPLTMTTASTRQSSAPHTSSASPVETTALAGAYDFEREYDFPPPGSPPRPSARALPNDFGNSNGLLPTAPVAVPKPRQSWFRRAVGAVLPTHYQRVPTSEGSSRHVVGGGTDNDGVFANVTAKPQPGRVIRTEDGNVHVVPEDSAKEAPPSYVEAQADAVPPYWETTIHAPAALDPNADLIIDDLPTGSLLIFCLNVFISFFFQFVGFLLTYLLHTSHAAKYGARAGLGLTLIQFGLASRGMGFADDTTDGGDSTSGTGTASVNGWPAPPTPSENILNGTTSADPAAYPGEYLSSTSKDWLSFLFMTLGWFLLLTSTIGFWRVKRWEQSVRTPPVPPTAEEAERDRNIRRNLEEVFGIQFDDTNASAQRMDDARLAINLRAAGLI